MRLTTFVIPCLLVPTLAFPQGERGTAADLRLTDNERLLIEVTNDKAERATLVRSFQVRAHSEACEDVVLIDELATGVHVRTGAGSVAAFDLGHTKRGPAVRFALGQLRPATKTVSVAGGCGSAGACGGAPATVSGPRAPAAPARTDRSSCGCSSARTVRSALGGCGGGGDCGGAPATVSGPRAPAPAPTERSPCGCSSTRTGRPALVGGCGSGGGCGGAPATASGPPAPAPTPTDRSPCGCSSARTVRSTEGGCGSTGGCGSSQPPLSYQAEFIDPAQSRTWADVALKAEHRPLRVGQRTLVKLTARVKPKDSAPLGYALLVPNEVGGAKLELITGPEGAQVRQTSPRTLLQGSVDAKGSTVEVVLAITPSHASTLRLGRIFQFGARLPKPVGGPAWLKTELTVEHTAMSIAVYTASVEMEVSGQ